ncbi:MAG: hypothetical protein KKG33_00740 [candidate division Zixibacteria bacterium]|nr:hypothetical protein [candidate division Zixibacteria bacterium]MBU2624065.1 hypothetical protein [candidate division Zixibacteria bacterium]
MGKIIKVRCDGPGKYVNRVDLEAVLDTDVVLRSTEKRKGSDIACKRTASYFANKSFCRLGSLPFVHSS